MASITVYPEAGEVSPVDGYVARQGVTQTFADIRAGAGTYNISTNLTSEATLQAHASTANRFQWLSRGILCFDTSAIPTGASITSVVLSLYGQGKSNTLGTADLHIAGATPASTSVLANSDYGQTQSTSFGSIAYADFSLTAYNDITLNASGIASINVNGITKLSTRTSYDILASFTGVWDGSKSSRFAYWAADKGTTFRPKLVVTYSLAVPTVTTQAATNVASSTATGNGNVTADGGATVTERGVCWNTTGTPTTADDTATTSGTTGAYSVAITGLAGSTLYYARAYATNSEGTGYGNEVTFTTVGLTNPENAYTSDNTYATATAPNGDISIQLSGDAGATYSSSLTKTFTGTEGSQTYGAGATELWGLSWTGDNVDDTSFRLKVTVGSVTHVYKTFGFAPGASVVLTGIEVSVEAKWDGTTTSIDHIKAKIYYGTSTVAVQEGSLAYDTTANALVVYNGSSWDELGSGGSGATTALDNLASVAINTTLVSDTDNTDDLGTTSASWRTLYMGTSIELGHDTDTTLTRSAAGTLAVEGKDVLTTDNTKTVTNKTINASQLVDGSVTSAKLAEAFFRGRHQAITTNTAPTALTFQFGWSWIIGISTDENSKTITFPTAFGSLPLYVGISFIGITSSEPDSIDDFQTEATVNHPYAIASDITTTSFLALVARPASQSMGTLYYGFSWQAIGTV